jgi:hypothetical protein
MRLVMTPRNIGTRQSGNVIAEVPCRDPHARMLLVSGHLDSWYLGTGAIAHASGVSIAAASAKRIMYAVRPLHNFRVLWIGAVSAGLASLAAYDNQPGAAAAPPPRWPAASRLSLASDRPTLVMLAHPRCSCTRASVGELAELMARAPDRSRVYVVFVKPGRVGANAAWEGTDLWRQAGAIPGATVVRDDDGHEAGLFRVETSGQTFLYAPDGALLFRKIFSHLIHLYRFFIELAVLIGGEFCARQRFELSGGINHKRTDLGPMWFNGIHIRWRCRLPG